MSTRIQHLCDYAATKTQGEHAATGSVEIDLGDIRFRIDLCDADRGLLVEQLMGLGFTPSRARVGKDTRDAYVTAAGAPFTAADARRWLIANGHELPESGRLSRALMELYAATH